MIAVLLGSSLKLLGTSNWVLGLTMLVFVAAYFGVQRLVRASLDLPAKAQKASV